MSNGGGEEWRDIPWHEGYQVSDIGHVRSVDRVLYGRRYKGQTLRTFALSTGHRHTSLGRGNQMLVHKLVLEAFVGPCPPNMEVCHWDGNASNNRLDNLRWDTRIANMADQKRHGTKPCGERSHLARLAVDDIRCIRAEPRGRGVAAMLARCFGVALGHVYDIRSGRRWAHVT